METQKPAQFSSTALHSSITDHSSSTDHTFSTRHSSIKMPLSAALKRLQLKMVSLQSPRIQCGCCAVGVFSAMFGIFMLSAGICIVLNVTFMEVDTSGLPPGLHNESGKKVVGIILICVALAALGLSATVSILYFTICSNRRRISSKGATTQAVARPGTPSRLSGQPTTALPHPPKRIHPPGKSTKPHPRSKPKLYPTLSTHPEEDHDTTKSAMEMTVSETDLSCQTSPNSHSETKTSRKGKAKRNSRVSPSEESSSITWLSEESSGITKPPLEVVDHYSHSQLVSEGTSSDKAFTFKQNDISCLSSEFYEGTSLGKDIIESSFITNSSIETFRVLDLKDVEDTRSVSHFQPTHSLQAATEHNIPHTPTEKDSSLSHASLSSSSSHVSSSSNIQQVQPQDGQDPQGLLQQHRGLEAPDSNQQHQLVPDSSQQQQLVSDSNQQHQLVPDSSQLQQLVSVEFQEVQGLPATGHKLIVSSDFNSAVDEVRDEAENL